MNFGEYTIVQWAVQMYMNVAEYAIPIAFVFGISNVIINTFLAAAFGGKMRIGGDK